MPHIIVGLVFLLAGLYGIARNWYAFLYMFWVIVPLVLIVIGVAAIVSGIGQFSQRDTRKKAAGTPRRSEG